MGVLLLVLCFSSLRLGSFVASTEAHGLYIGMVEGTHSESGKVVLWRVRVFYDDLQSAVRNAYPQKFKPEVPEKWPAQNRILVDSYFKKHLRCVINGKSSVLQLTNVQLEGEVYWVELQSPTPPKWSGVDVYADFLMELFPNQSNVVQIQQGKEKRFGRTTKTVRSLRFDW